VPSRDQRLAETLVSLADTLVADFDVVDLFCRLVDAATELLDVDAAGLLLADNQGELQVMAVTNEEAAFVEMVQVQREKGPCFDAYRTGEVIGASLTDHDSQQRWPTFSAAALEAGFVGVLALPMHRQDSVLGALNLFRVKPGALGESDLIAAKALTGLATIAILQSRIILDSEAVIAQLQGALDSRVVIEQAKGIISEKTQIGMDQAFARLRKHARDNNQRLENVAREIVSGSLDPERLPEI
jgi:GAF domain-containing protein